MILVQGRGALQQHEQREELQQTPAFVIEKRGLGELR
jgi:hypothetical protein